MEIRIRNNFTMKKNLNILWIDDVAERKEGAAKALELHKDKYFKIQSMHVDFVNVKDKNLLEEIKPKLNNRQPDAVIIDHFLDKSKDSTIKKGSSIAQILRERWPNCPIIGITAAQKYKDIDFEDENSYINLYSSADISSNFNAILSIITSYYKLSRMTFEKYDDFFKLLKPPQDDIKKLKNIFPFDLKEHFNMESLIFRLSRWIRYYFYNSPGFLYDELWAATLLGLNIEGFKRAKKYFDKSIYDGIFFDPSDTRWWSSTLRSILFKKYPQNTSNLPWVVGRDLTNIKSHYSKCHACGKDFPEIVGFVDETKERRVQLHLKCSIQNDKEEYRLYFEPTRIMKGAD